MFRNRSAYGLPQIRQAGAIARRHENFISPRTGSLFSNESCAFVGIEHRRAQGDWAGYPNDAIHRDAARNLLGLKTSEESTAVATPSQS